MQRLQQTLHRKTQRNLKIRIYAHKWSIKTNDDRNTLFSHMVELKHTFNFSKATLIKPIHWKTPWRLLESAVISKTNHIKQRPGFYQISSFLANIILNENKIKIKNGSGKRKHFFALCHHPFENLYFLFFLIICPLTLPQPNYNPDTHNIDNFLWYYSIVNIFSMKQVMSKILFTQTLPYFFLINSLKSITTFKTKIFNGTWYIWL